VDIIEEEWNFSGEWLWGWWRDHGGDDWWVLRKNEDRWELLREKEDRWERLREKMEDKNEWER